MPEEPVGSKEPFLLWWMPIVAFAGPLIFAAWRAVSVNDDALERAAVALVWPGIGLYAGLVAVLWAGWKIDLE